MRQLIILYLFLTLSIITTENTYSQQFQPNWNSLDKRPIPQWWQDAKFGIFVHWGIYSVPAYAPTDESNVYAKYSEHYANRLSKGNKKFIEHHTKFYGSNFSYSDFASMFKAEYFNPNEWAELFRKSGAKYVVLTSKHHDGFCLWPSKYNPKWNSMEIGPHRDLLGELTEAVRAKGLHMGYYYSLLEWEHPLYSKETINQWVDKLMIPQMMELTVKYKPEIIFSDGEWDYDSKTLKSEQFLSWLYNESPVKQTIIVNDRWGKETRNKHGGYYTTEYDLVHDKLGIGDKASHPWEESRGIGGSYGYNQFENAAHYFSSKQLIDILIEKVSNGGNLLLNIGPEANGLIPVVMQERLLDIGKWLNINGESIYETRPWINKNKDNKKGLYFTRKKDILYVICTEWVKDSITLKDIKKAENIEMLGYKGDIEFILNHKGLTIIPPDFTVNESPCEHAWVYKITNFKD